MPLVEVILSPVIQQQGEVIRSSPKLMETAMRRAATRIKKRLLDDARLYPPPRMRSRYLRTYNLRRGMQATVQLDERGGRIDLFNGVYYADVVVGNRQTWFHRDTGWRTLKTIVSAHTEEAQTVVQETWFTVSDPAAGVRG